MEGLEVSPRSRYEPGCRAGKLLGAGGMAEYTPETGLVEE